MATAAEFPSFLINGVTAHRGGGGEAPENTLTSFAHGIAAGADWIELDIFRTRDGQLVVSHDKTTRRVGDLDLAVTASTYDELRTVDVATSFRAEHHLTLEECPPLTMPLLEDVLRLVLTQNRTRVSIQPKMDCVSDAIALIKRLHAESMVGFNDGSLPLMSAVKKLAPSIPVFWDRGESDIDEDIRIAKENGFETLVINAKALTPAKVTALQRVGLGIGVWTVNDETSWDRFLDMGVQRIYTDFPTRLLARQAARGFRPVTCQGVYPGHLQGVCTNDKDAIFWSWTTFMVKTDLQGRILIRIPVATHHGDVCYHDGKLYCAVNLGAFNKPAGQEDSWVYEYDAETLREVARHKVPELVHGAGGMAYHDGRFVVIGGLPPGTEENYLYEYDASFTFLKRHVLPSGYTLMGIQTAAFAEGSWWFGCYGKPPVLLRADANFSLTGKWEFNAAVGIIGIPGDRFFIAENRGVKGLGNTARLAIAHADAKNGLTKDE